MSHMGSSLVWRCYIGVIGGYIGAEIVQWILRIRKISKKTNRKREKTKKEKMSISVSRANI